MTFNEISLLLIFLFPLAYSPGPGNIFFAALGARYGSRASLAANLGYHLATFVVSFAIGVIGLIATIFTLNNMVAFLVWTVAGQSLAKLFKTPKNARLLNAGFARLLGAVSIWMLLS